MALTLTESRSLIDVLGVKIPEDILTQMAKAEEFAARREKIIADGGSKAADWPLKAKFDDVLKRASDSAGQKQFDAGLKLLDEAAQILVQPDTASASPEAPSASGAGLAAIWLEAKERVDKQVSLLQGALRQTKDPRCLRIADMGLNAVTGKLQVGLHVALTEWDKAGGRDANLGAKAASVIAQYQQFLQTDAVVALCDENPFGVQCDIRGTLLPALNELETSLKG